MTLLDVGKGLFGLGDEANACALVNALLVSAGRLVRARIDDGLHRRPIAGPCHHIGLSSR